MKQISKIEEKEKMKKAKNDKLKLIQTSQNAIIVVVWFLSIFIMIPFSTIDFDGNGRLQSILLVVFLVGIFFIPPRTGEKSFLARLVALAGCSLSILIIFSSLSVEWDDSIHHIYRYQIMKKDELIFSFIVFFSIITIIRIIIKRSVARETNKILDVVKAILIIGIFLITYKSSNTFAWNYGNKSLMGANKYDSIYQWPSTGLSTYIPKPDSKNIIILYDYDAVFKIKVYKATKAKYETYIQTCTDKGFNLDSKRKDHEYRAYNSKGYKLTISLYKEVEMNVEVEEPIKMKKISWPSSAPSEILPRPQSDIGEIESDSDYMVSLYIGNTSLNDFNDYINKCLNSGFNVDYSRCDESFYAYDKNGNEIKVEYMGNNTMYIKIYHHIKVKTENIFHAVDCKKNR